MKSCIDNIQEDMNLFSQNAVKEKENKRKETCCGFLVFENDEHIFKAPPSSYRVTLELQVAFDLNASKVARMITQPFCGSEADPQRRADRHSV